METRVHRDHEAPWVLPDLPGSLVGGAALVLMEPEACLGRPEPRETVGLMVLLDCLERKDTEVNPDLKDLRGHQEKMEREVTMERSGQGVCLANQDPVVCLDQRDLRVRLVDLV